MFLQILYLITDGMASVVRALEVELFSVGSISISFWEIILGIFVVGLIFSFFLVPRAGSGLQGIGNLVRSDNQRKASEQNNSYEAYASRRSRNEAYSKRYNSERR